MAKVGITLPNNYGVHKMGYRHVTTGDFGRLQPVMCQECVPGDQIDLDIHQFVTVAPNPSPINGKMIGHLECFFVPNRVVWSGWNNYIAGFSETPIPQVDLYAIQQLVNQYGRDGRAVMSSLGLPVWSMNVGPEGQSYPVSILPIRALNRIWWDYYRDSNVIPDTNESSYVTNGNNGLSLLSAILSPKYRCYGRNYFTTALRSPNADGVTYANNNTVQIENGSVTLWPDSNYSVNGNPSIGNDGLNLDNFRRQVDFVPNNVGTEDYTSSQNTTVQSLRAAYSLQRFFEKCNVLGGRLIDRLRGMFNSSVSPITLQMSEYIGGSAFDINFESSTASAAGATYDQIPDYNNFGSTSIDQSIQGQLRGKSTGTGELKGIKYHVKEHGFFIVIASIVPDPLYYQGINRMWKRGISTLGASRFDFLTEEMVGLGFQPITYDEVVTLPRGLAKGDYTPNSVFGYAERYADYKYNHDRLSGDFFGTNVEQSMASWHLGRNLWREAGVVDANGSIISGKTGSDIIDNINRDTISMQTGSTGAIWDSKFSIQDPTHDHFVCDFKFDLTMTRPLPSISYPTIELHTPITTAKVGGTRF